MRKPKGPSNNPQQVNDSIWYYESRGNIHIFLDWGLVSRCAQEQIGCNFKIRKHMLKKSLKRMGP